MRLTLKENFVPQLQGHEPPDRIAVNVLLATFHSLRQLFQVVHRNVPADERIFSRQEVHDLRAQLSQPLRLGAFKSDFVFSLEHGGLDEVLERFAKNPFADAIANFESGL